MPIPTPSSLVLDARAEYVADGDTVLVTVFLLDPEANLGFPGYVKTGTCSLLYRNNIIQTIEFDRRFGNGEGDGDFIFQFSHPPVQTDMRIKVEVVTDLTVYGNPPHPQVLSKNVPVTRADDPYIPLTEQLDSGPDANNEYRSKLRLKEGL